MYNIDPKSLIEMIKLARKRVPIIDFAAAIAFIAIVGSIIVSSLGYNISAIFVIGFVLIGIVLIIALVAIVVQPSPGTRYAGIFMLWAVTICFCSFIIFGTTAIIFGFPQTLYNLMIGTVVAPPVVIPDATKIPKGATDDTKWTDAGPIEEVLTTLSHHCSSNCRGEPTRTGYKLNISVPSSIKPPARLTNVKLECIGGACPWSQVISTRLSPDGQTATANFDVWGNPTTWKLSATLQTAR